MKRYVRIALIVFVACALVSPSFAQSLQGDAAGKGPGAIKSGKAQNGNRPEGKGGRGGKLQPRPRANANRWPGKRPPGGRATMPDKSFQQPESEHGKFSDGSTGGMVANPQHDGPNPTEGTALLVFFYFGDSPKVTLVGPCALNQGCPGVGRRQSRKRRGDAHPCQPTGTTDSRDIFNEMRGKWVRLLFNTRLT